MLIEILLLVRQNADQKKIVEDDEDILGSPLTENL